MKPISIVVLALAGLGALYADGPEFEVVTIRLNKSGDQEMRANMLPSGQFNVRNLRMTDLLQFAYNVHEEFLINAPGWTKSDHYDLIGNAGVGTKEDILRAMLRNFLAKDFKLEAHMEERPMDVFVLTVGKNGPKLQKAAGTGEPDCKRVGGPVQNGQQHEECKNMTMQALAEVLPGLAPRYVDRTVVDRTGIEGTYDFRLDWVGANFIDQGGLTMPDAVDKLLGLKLDQRKLPMQVVVIDHLERLVNDDQ